MRQAIERFGTIIIAGVDWLGGLTGLALRAMRAGPRLPIGINDIAHQMVEQGIKSLPMATFLMLFIGMIIAWQFGWALIDFGATMALGNVTSEALVKELVPTVLALTVGAKIAAGMAAELGSMKVTEQIDAVAALGADPIKKLVWPRVAGATLALPLLAAWGNVVALLGAMLIGETVYSVPAGYFWETYIDELAPMDYVWSIIKVTIYGYVVGLVGCYQGFNTKFGTEAVGLSTMQTVVATAVCTLIADLYLTMIIF